MSKRKTIIFILDSFELYGFNTKYKHVDYTYCYSYFDTEDAINAGIDNINTYDIGHLSFDLEDLGYDIFIGYNGKIYMFRTGMSTANGKELRKGHNLRRLLIGGALDDDLKIDRNKFYYDKSIPTSELCQQELNLQKAAIDCALKVTQKTIGFELGNGIKAMSPEESYEWHKKHSKIDPKTGNMIISDNEIGDGTFEKKYLKP
jgi:hypothetical protein